MFESWRSFQSFLVCFCFVPILFSFHFCIHIFCMCCVICNLALYNFSVLVSFVIWKYQIWCLVTCVFYFVFLSSVVLSFCNFCHLSCCLLLFCHFVVCCVVVCYFAICCFVFCLVLSCNLFLVDMIIFAIFCVWYPAIVVILISILYLTNAWTFSAEHLSLHWIQHWMSTKLEKYLHLSKSLPFSYVLFFGKLSLKKKQFENENHWLLNLK